MARVFDFSFEHFVTTSIIKVIFVVLLIAEGLYALVAARAGTGMVLVALILVPAGWFVAALVTRIWMELLIVIFKIKEDLGAIRSRGGF
ncbi:DUF4282 domain-containing protein [Microbispora sp. NBC_01389]|uniref:DUF4282 domain-containing protein n=1 Tax=Microbispora sp. NBC_01389 TaxID=2903584 RepID=UPI00324F8891